MPIFSLSGTRPTNLGVSDGRLLACPASPNCVSSYATDERHAIAPLRLAISPVEGWAAARTAVAALPRTTIVRTTDDYLHAECQSALLGFVDDLELHLHANEGVIAVRSASRLGYSDLGVNRKRVEGLRSALIQHGAVK